MSTEAWALAAAIATMAVMSAAGVVYARTRRHTIEDFISARGSTGGLAAMATTAASVMGVWILFAPAETGADVGLAAVIGYGVGQAAPIAAFIVLGPRMRKLAPNGHSLSEFALQRYGAPMFRLTLCVVLLYMFLLLAAEMGAIARAVDLVADVPLQLTLVLVGAATLGYTVYGGLRASIFTDKIQFAAIIPLILILLVAALVDLGGWSLAFDRVRDVDPDLLDLGNAGGIEFGITLIIAILAADIFNQGFWQRVYAAKTDGDVRRGFLAAGALMIPVIVGVGLFGVWAAGLGVVDDDRPAAIALFTLAMDVLPGWALVALTALALMLVMSSMDTLLNGMASVFATDLSRLRPGVGMLASTRLITGLIIVPAAIVGFLFDSVLYLFFIADLACAGAVVPVFSGMWSRRLSSRGAMTASFSGIAAGALFFPTRSFEGWWTWDALTNAWGLLESGNLLASFLAAVVVSSVVAGLFVLAARRRGGAEFDLESLSAEIRRLESGA